MDCDPQKLPIARAVHEQLDSIVERTQLDPCGWIDIHLALGILIDSLNALREEGVALKPDVYLFCEADKSLIKKALGFHHYFQVGSFRRSDDPSPLEIFTTAIKKCALLAKREWSLFIKWTSEEINYGVMRRPTSLLSESPRELITRSNSAPAILLYQESEHSIEIRSHSNFIEHIRFLAMHHSCQSPEEERQRLIRVSVQDIPDQSVLVKTSALLSTILHEAVVDGHGFLIGVQPFEAKLQNSNNEWINPPHYHPSIADGNYFQKWIIPLGAKVELYQKSFEAAHASVDPDHIQNTIDLGAGLRAWADLVPTMLSSDGMTLLNSNAQVLGYRIFVSELAGAQRKPARYKRPEDRSGGGRWRAFKHMWLLVDAGLLLGAYYQSQDGAAFWYGP